MTSQLAGAALLLAVVAAAPAAAQIYKCPGPDGQVLFTSDASQCPGQKAHESSGSLQNVAPRSEPSLAPTPRPAAPRRPRYDPAVEEAQANVWRGKKQQAERELGMAKARLPGLRKAAGWCNRGDSVYRTDDLGIRRDVPCEDLKDELAALEATTAKLESYLEEGLEEECRRAGCLPGWVR